MQVLINRIENADENESSLLFQLLGTVVESGQEKVAVHIPLIVSSLAGVISKNIPGISEPWPQVCQMQSVGQYLGIALTKWTVCMKIYLLCDKPFPSIVE